MIPVGFALAIICLSMFVTIGAFLVLAKREESYVNIFLPAVLFSVPALYLLPLLHIGLFGTEASTYAYLYIYGSLAVESVAFVFGYVRTQRRSLKLPFTWSYQNFDRLAIGCLMLAGIMYAPTLLQFREFLFDPRQIYNLTRTGFGPQFFLSSTLSYLAIILVLFADCSRLMKAGVIAVSTGLLLLHGSKGEVLNGALILALYYVYVRQRKVGFKGALIVCTSLALIVLLLFAATMTLGDGPMEIVESLTRYSDYTRNAMLVIDSRVPLQYGRLTIESNTIALVPRILMPDKRRNFGPFFLTERLFPDWYDAETSPAFGLGVQYADFGVLAVIYIGLFAFFKGWLARLFVNRLQLYKHPGDFFVVAFLADIGLFPLGVGWFLPETLVVAVILRYFSTFGAAKIYAERRSSSRLSMAQRGPTLGDARVS